VTTKPWEKRGEGRRPTGTRARRRVLIVCEDSKSACYYFKSFEIDASRAEVVALGTGMNTDSLIENAIKRGENAVREGQPYNQIWCVFDRDSFPLTNYDRAFQLARANGIKVAWANEAFELWYLLHFNYVDTGVSRDEYKAKLRRNFEYDKADRDIYEKIKDHQETAFKNAHRLERHWNDCGEKFPERQNPSLGVHKLVEFLNELADLGSTTD
jgi:hypothetical protein